MSWPLAEATVIPNSSVAVEEIGPVELILVALSLAILAVFITSLVKWISLLRRGKRLFGANALIPARARYCPFWMAIDFFVFFGALLVVNGVMGSLFAAVGWIEAASPVKSGTTETPALFSVGRLVLNSVGMMGATLIMMGILALRQNQTWARVGWKPRRGDIVLGFQASLLILPPTMVLMGLVSTLQKYSHPVLDTLKSSDAGTDYSVFAVLFVTTAIVTPLVEEFWFRGLLQGGLQRLADVRFRGAEAMVQEHDGEASVSVSVDNNERFGDSESAHRSSGVDGRLDGASLLPFGESGNPYQSPPDLAEGSNTAGLDANKSAFVDEADPSLRADWTPIAIWPMFVASLVFALMHWGQGLAPIPLFFLSLGLGYLYRQTGSLIPSIVVHFVLNGFTMTATLLELLRAG